MRTNWLVGVTVLVAACGGSKTKGANEGGITGGMGEMKMGMADPAPATKAVLDGTEDYTSWARFSEMQQPTRSEGHMNNFVLSYYNQVVADAIQTKTVPLPDGAVIVKQQMKTADAPPMSITVMSKQGGAWYWVSATPDGMKVMTVNGMPIEGDVAMCKDCHDSAADNDFVLTHQFK